MAKNAPNQGPAVGLVMIVKDECNPVFYRCLQSALPLIDTYTICDTGSTDDTIGMVKQVLGHLPGKVYRHKWRSFGENLNMAFARAKGTAKWLLRLDADMEITFLNERMNAYLRRDKDRTLGAWDIPVDDHGLKYLLPLIVRGTLDWRYVGKTHEYLDATGRRKRPLTGIVVTHHGRPGNRREKLEGDIELLADDAAKGDPRAVFYTAESYRYLGNYSEALKWYRQRVELGGWEEERWYAAYQAAFLTGNLEGLIKVWRERPWRHEPLSAAARMVAETTPTSGDSLFLEQFGQPVQPLPFHP